MAAGYAPPGGERDELPWFVPILRRLRPREGWTPLGLALLGIGCLPAVVISGRPVEGLGSTAWLSALGVVFGWWLGRYRRPGWQAAAATLLAGAVAVLAIGVRVVNIWPPLGQALRWVYWLFQCRLDARCREAAPSLAAFAEQAAALAGFARRVGWWFNGVYTGRGIPDNLVLIGAAGLIAWLLAAWAGWWLSRHKQPFIAVLPTGILLAQAVYWLDVGYGWLLTFIGVLPPLFVLIRYQHAVDEWEANATDYSPELRWEAASAGLIVTAALLVLSPGLPFLTSPELSRAFWRMFEQPYRQVETRLAESFPGMEGRRSLVPPAGIATSGLPRSHLLGGAPELGQEIALRVQVRGAQSSDDLRWRGQTFAYYDGRSWQQSPPADEAALPTPGILDLPAGQAWSTTQPAGRHPVLASVEPVAAARAVVYSAGEPVSVDQRYQALVRAPGDAVGLFMPDQPLHYTVLGLVTGPDANTLRSAGHNYPAEVRALYLDLPSDLPEQVSADARALTQGARTPYDAALAIQTELRKLPYSLDVPAPPAGREVVSWFLYDLRRGYCDYFASAMVVMARASGIPARLAIGYAPGKYDPESQTYVVAELDAHSWPELYFPGQGWVSFEPTPAQPEPARAGEMPPGELDLSWWVEEPPDMQLELDELRQLAEVHTLEARRVQRLQAVLGAVNGLIAIWLAWLWLRGRRTPLEDEPARWLSKLAWWGAAIGVPMRVSDTAREYAVVVGEAAERAAERSVSRRSGARVAAQRVRIASGALAEQFDQARFAPLSEGNPEEELGPRWQDLWAAFRRLWLARRWRI